MSEIELKPCPFCGGTSNAGEPNCVCSSDPLMHMSRGAWDTRPIEDALRQRIQAYQDDYHNVMAENCAGDEKHCTCVPPLRKRIAELEARTRWIPVEERLPEHDLPVMTISYGDYEIAFYDGEEWFDNQKEWTDGVTHWMELPALPVVKP
jgi:hypothetical protein